MHSIYIITIYVGGLVSEEDSSAYSAEEYGSPEAAYAAALADYEFSVAQGEDAVLLGSA